MSCPLLCSDLAYFLHIAPRATRFLPAYLVFALSIWLPWLTWIRLGGLPPPQAVTLTPSVLFLLTGGAIAALWVALQEDPWLGGILLVSVASTGLSPSPISLGALTMMGAGVAVLLAARHSPVEWARSIKAALLVSGVSEAVYAWLQRAGYDPVWAGTERLANPAVHGTFGNPTYLGAFLALLAPVAPPILWPVFGLGVFVSRSQLALVSLTAGLLISASLHVIDRSRWLLLWAVSGLALFVSLYLAAGFHQSTLNERLFVWRLSWGDFRPRGLHWLLGYGPGHWWPRMLERQLVLGGAGLTWNNFYTLPHNEWLQLGYEGGFLSLVCLLGWLWVYRSMWTGPYAGSLVALAILACGTFPFHLATLAAPALVIVGLATRNRGLPRSDQAGPP